MIAVRCGLLAALVLGLPASAQDDQDALTGTVELGYREADANGSADKYREDVNLSDGALRLFAAGLRHEPAEGFYDRLVLDAAGLGGEPYTSARLGLRKTGRYELDLRYRSSDYFYRDAGYWFRDGGDLHTWNARRNVFGLGLSIDAGEKVRLRFGADRTEREGDSTTSRDIQRDEFVLTRPVDQLAQSYWAAADFRVGWADLTVEQRFASSENRWDLTASATDGEEPGDAFLDTYRQLRVEESDVPITRLVARGRPHRRVRFSVGYLRADAELDYRADGQWNGLDFTSASFDTVLANVGRVERQTDVIDVDVSLDLHDDVDLLIDYSNRAYEQDGEIDYLEVQTGGADQGSFPVRGVVTNELELDTYGVTADWRVTRELSLAVGVGQQQRTKRFELFGPEVETERTLYRAGLGWRPGRRFDLRVDLEQGDDDDPLTAVSPTSTERLALRAGVRPTEGLQLALRFLDETRENELATPLGLATDDVPPATDISLARFDVQSWALTATWSREDLDLLVGYASSEIDLDAHIVFVTDSTLVPVFDITTTRQSTAYLAEQDVIQARLRYRFGERWSAGLYAVTADTGGSFPVDSLVYGAHGRYEHSSGVFFRLAYDSYDYDEDNPFAAVLAAGPLLVPAPDVNDYDAELWTASVGFSF